MSDILRRLTALETGGASGLALLQQVSGAGVSGLGYSSPGGNQFQWMSGAAVPQATFTLSRPQPILVFAEIGGFYGSGGTAQYVTTRLAIMSSSTAMVGANDVNGVEMATGHCYQTNGTEIANAFHCKCWTVPAGTYYVGLGYAMQGGATTTFNLLQNSIQVFAVAG